MIIFESPYDIGDRVVILDGINAGYCGTVYKVEFSLIGCLINVEVDLGEPPHTIPVTYHHSRLLAKFTPEQIELRDLQLLQGLTKLAKL